jgi:NADH-quinone oxidoreductase subunit N
LLSVSLYVLIAYPRRQAASLEAAAKYLVLAATSSAFLLFGMALVYAGTGTMEFGRLAAAAPAHALHPLFSGGLALMAAGIAFKLALVPFHLWTPDVYQGAPAPVTAFVATVSKGAVFALLFRLFGGLDVHQFRPLLLAFSGIAVASMLGGTFLALLQDNLKRILAYSSIAHLGFLLVAFLSNGEDAATAVGFYLVAYFLSMMGAFGVVTALSGPERDPEDLQDYRGLMWRRPWLAGTLAAMMLSLAGIPLTAGFFGKLSVLLAGLHSDLWLLVIVLVTMSAVGLFYYLRVLVALCTPAGEAEGAPLPFSAGNLVLAVLVLLLVLVGIQPAPVVAIIQTMVAQSF